MRVLRTEGSDQLNWTPRLCTHSGQPYAILSHRWANDPNYEVLFADIEKVDELRFGEGTDEYQSAIKNAQYVGVHPGHKPGFKKVQGAARQALNDGYSFIWIDTCCIDKNSSAELSEAINSMWAWYKSSDVCYVYLADVVDSNPHSELAQSSWWTRGWTLQELLAPRELIFFTAVWEVIGLKKRLHMQISDITNINPNIVNGTIPLQSVSIAQRMSWISNRKTTRIEDLAYCLLGLFDVHMPLLYGEGENAFLRLQQEVIRDSDDETIFAWRDESIERGTLHGLLATSPRAFATCSRAVRYQDSDTRLPYAMTNKGLSITVTLSHVEKRIYAAKLHCPDPEADGEYTGVYLEKVSEMTEQYARVRCGERARQQSSQETKKTVYIKQHHDQRPAYTTLGSSNVGKVRLFRILQAEDVKVIRLELVEADVELSRYSIVSYIWDRPDDDVCTIWVNSETQKISKNLYNLLQLMRQSRDDKLLWIDSICVQQMDYLEKELVVKIWANISSYAEECIIWLGNIYENSRQPPRQHPLFQPDELVNSGQIGKSGMTIPQFRKKHSMLLAIAVHPYWRRIWSLQDFFASKVYVEFIGNISNSVAMLPTRRRMTFEQLSALHASALEDVRVHSLPSIDTLFMSEVLQFVRTRSKSASKSCRSFEDLLTKFQYQDATDPRDRVYALIPLSDPRFTCPPGYSLSRAQTVCYVAASLGDRLTLSILPKLINALEISALPAEDRNNNCREFMIYHNIHSLESTRVSNIGSFLSATDPNWPTDQDYYTLEDNCKVSRGLLFVKNSSPLARKGQKEYRPRCLYHHKWSNGYWFSRVPAPYEKALANTSITLQVRTTLLLQCLIKTDSQGLLALALCMQTSLGGFPRIFEEIR